jgi:uncharacterized protein
MKLETKLLESKTLIDTTIDLSHLIERGIDLIALNNVRIKGVIHRQFDEVKFDLSVQLEVVQKCTYTLKPVHYPLEFDCIINFSNDEETYDYIPQDIIDLDEVIFAEILLYKEPNVYHESASADEFQLEHQPHPAFKSLKEKKKE